MTQRISDKLIDHVIKNQRDYTVTIIKFAMDLRDARTRIAELDTLSASQEQAHALRDAGAKL